MIVKNPTAPYIQAFINGAEQKAKELGVKVDIKDGQADSLKIMELMDNFIVQKVDGLIMAGAVDLKAIVPGVKRLNEAGIPIIALDTSPEAVRLTCLFPLTLKSPVKELRRYLSRASRRGITEKYPRAL